MEAVIHDATLCSLDHYTLLYISPYKGCPAGVLGSLLKT